MKNSSFSASSAFWYFATERRVSTGSNMGTSLSPLKPYTRNWTEPFYRRSAGVVPSRSASTAYSCPCCRKNATATIVASPVSALRR